MLDEQSGGGGGGGARWRLVAYGHISRAGSGVCIRESFTVQAALRVEGLWLWPAAEYSAALITKIERCGEPELMHPAPIRLFKPEVGVGPAEFIDRFLHYGSAAEREMMAGMAVVQLRGAWLADYPQGAPGARYTSLGPGEGWQLEFSEPVAGWVVWGWGLE